ncbi:MAG: sulfatase [Verrucomicrobiaceae bacterium]|nr:sulfatase [Verrucomicrobiaceae bacterium]
MSYDPCTEFRLNLTRRHFLQHGTTAGIGAAALSSLLDLPQLHAATMAENNGPGYEPGTPGPVHFPARAKRVIYLFQSGAPSQIDTFDYKPTLEKLNGQNLPDSVRGKQRLTGMTAGQKSFPAAKSFTKFHQHGQSGQWISDLLPFHHQIADDICIIKSMHTEAINHDPAITFFQTGHQQPGRPSLGAWASYGLGSTNANLPAFVVLLDKNSDNQAQPTYSRLWGSGFLPSNHQGVKLRGIGDPVLYLKDPTEAPLKDRRDLLDTLSKLNQERFKDVGDPEITTRIAQYEMAYRMQMSVPELTNFSDEPESTFKLYGEDARIPGTHAANCLLARRLAERDVRFIQLYHRGWDHHSNLPNRHPRIAREVDQGSSALIRDLKERGMLEDTLVIWGGEFGRTVYRQGGNANSYGRDHHPRCFSIWMAGGGIKGGMSFGETDDWCYNIVDKDSKGVHIHDLNATILHLLGINHERLTYRFQGRHYRLTDVHGQVLKSLLT